MVQDIRFEMPVNAFFFLLKSVPCREAVLLPRHTVTEQNAAREYLRARELWTQEGWAELDFDGSLQPSRSFARLLYNLSRRYAVLRWEREGTREFYVKGPVDLLQITEREGRSAMALAGNNVPLERFREELSVRPEGTLEVLRVSDRASLRISLDGLSPEEEALKAAAEGFKLFYEEAEPDA